MLLSFSMAVLKDDCLVLSAHSLTYISMAPSTEEPLRAASSPVSLFFLGILHLALNARGGKI